MDDINNNPTTPEQGSQSSPAQPVNEDTSMYGASNSADPQATQGDPGVYGNGNREQPSQSNPGAYSNPTSHGYQQHPGQGGPAGYGTQGIPHDYQAPPQGQPYAYSAPPATPMDVDKWNWGAFTFSIWWGIGHKVYLPLLCLVPLLNIVWVFVCGAKGNTWLWETGQYKTVDELNASQESWKRAGFVAFIACLVVFAISIFFILIAGAALISLLGSEYYNNNTFY